MNRRVTNTSWCFPLKIKLHSLGEQNALYHGFWKKKRGNAVRSGGANLLTNLWDACISFNVLGNKSTHSHFRTPTLKSKHQGASNFDRKGRWLYGGSKNLKLYEYQKAESGQPLMKVHSMSEAQMYPPSPHDAAVFWHDGRGLSHCQVTTLHCGCHGRQATWTTAIDNKASGTSVK